MGWIEPEFRMFQVIVFREIVVPPVMLRLSWIKPVDEEEIGLPHRKNDFFQRMVRGQIRFGQPNPPVKRIVRTEIVLLHDRDFDIGIPIRVIVGSITATFGENNSSAYDLPHVMDAIHPGKFELGCCRGQGISPVAPVGGQGAHGKHGQDDEADETEKAQDGGGDDRASDDPDEDMPCPEPLFHGFQVFGQMIHRGETVQLILALFNSK